MNAVFGDVPCLRAANGETWMECVGDCISSWLENKPEWIEEQQKKMITMALCPFLLGVSDNLPSAWIRLLHNCGLLEKGRESVTVPLTDLEMEKLEMVILIFERCVQLVLSKNDLKTILNYINDLEEKSTIDRAVDIGGALHLAADLEVFKSMWAPYKRKFEKKKKQAQVAIVYFFKTIQHHVVHYGRDGMDKYEQTIARVNAKIKRSSDDDPEEFRGEAATAYRSKDYPTALENYNRAIALDPFEFFAYANRAQTRIKLKNIKAAICDCKRALVIDPSFYKSYLDLANCFLYLGQFDKAEEANAKCLALCKDDKYKEVVMKQKEDIIKHRENARHRGDTGQAVSSESGDSLLQHRWQLCEGYASYRQGKYQAAVDKFHSALEMAAQNSAKQPTTEEDDVLVLQYVYAKSCLATEKAHNLQIAIDKFQHITSSSSHFPVAFYGLACAYKLLHRYKEALEVLAQGLPQVKSLQAEGKSHIYLWPQTDQVIEETNLSKLLKLMTDLEKECLDPPKPEAVCRMHTDTENPQTEIYTSDLGYKGHVMLKCHLKCCIAFHQVCWKAQKAKHGDHRQSDKEMLDTACPTPNCNGLVFALYIYKKGGEKPVLIESTLHFDQPKDTAPPRPKIRSDNPEKLKKKEERKRVKRQKKAEARAKEEENQKNKELSMDKEEFSIIDFGEEPKFLDGNVKLVQLKKEEAEEVKPKVGKTKKKKEKNKTILQVDIQYNGDNEKLLYGAHSLDEDGYYVSHSGPWLGLPPTMPGTPVQPSQTAGLLPQPGTVALPLGNGLLPAPMQLTLDKTTVLLYQHFVNMLSKTGPLDLNDPNLGSTLAKLSLEAQNKIIQHGGLVNFLKSNETAFCVIESRVICLQKDKFQGMETFRKLQREAAAYDGRGSPQLSSAPPPKTFSWEQRAKEQEAKRKAEDAGRQTPSPSTLQSRLNPSAKEFNPSPSSDIKLNGLSNGITASSITNSHHTNMEDQEEERPESELWSGYDRPDSIDLYSDPNSSKKPSSEMPETVPPVDEGFVIVTNKKAKKTAPRPSISTSALSSPSVQQIPKVSSSMNTLDTIRLDDKPMKPKTEAASSGLASKGRVTAASSEPVEENHGQSNGQKSVSVWGGIKLDHLPPFLRQNVDDTSRSEQNSVSQTTQVLSQQPSHATPPSSSQSLDSQPPSKQSFSNSQSVTPQSSVSQPSLHQPWSNLDPVLRELRRGSDVSDMSSEGHQRSASPASSTHSLNSGSQSVAPPPKPLTIPGVALPSRGKRGLRSSSRLSNRSSSLGIRNTSSEGSTSHNGEDEDADSVASSFSNEPALHTSPTKLLPAQSDMSPFFTSPQTSSDPLSLTRLNPSLTNVTSTSSSSSVHLKMGEVNREPISSCIGSENERDSSLSNTVKPVKLPSSSYILEMPSTQDFSNPFAMSGNFWDRGAPESKDTPQADKGEDLQEHNSTKFNSSPLDFTPSFFVTPKSGSSLKQNVENVSNRFPSIPDMKPAAKDISSNYSSKNGKESSFLPFSKDSDQAEIKTNGKEKVELQNASGQFKEEEWFGSWATMSTDVSGWHISHIDSGQLNLQKHLHEEIYYQTSEHNPSFISASESTQSFTPAKTSPPFLSAESLRSSNEAYLSKLWPPGVPEPARTPYNGTLPPSSQLLSGRDRSSLEDIFSPLNSDQTEGATESQKLRSFLDFMKKYDSGIATVSESLSAESLTREQGSQTHAPSTASVLTNTALTLQTLAAQEAEIQKLCAETDMMVEKMRKLEEASNRYQLLLSEQQQLLSTQAKELQQMETIRQKAYIAERENEKYQQKLLSLNESNLSLKSQMVATETREAEMKKDSISSMERERQRAQEAEIKVLTLGSEMTRIKTEVAMRDGYRNLIQLQNITKQFEQNQRPLPESLTQKVQECQEYLQACQRRSQEAVEAFKHQILEVQIGKQLSDLPLISMSPPPMPEPPTAMENQLYRDSGRVEQTTSDPNDERMSDPVDANSNMISKGQPNVANPTPSTESVFQKPDFLKTPSALSGFNPQQQQQAPHQRLIGTSPIEAQAFTTASSNTPQPFKLFGAQAFTTASSNTPQLFKPFGAQASMTASSNTPQPFKPLGAQAFTTKGSSNVAQKPKPLKPLGGSSQSSGPLSMFDRVMKNLNQRFPDLKKPDVVRIMHSIRQSNGGTFSGLECADVVEKVTAQLSTQGLVHSASAPTMNSQISSVDESDPPIECTICTEEIHHDLRLLECSHGFHTQCIKTWFETQRTCPNCRVYSLLPEEFPSLR